MELKNTPEITSNEMAYNMWQEGSQKKRKTK
jgi:hypothetical protein